MELTEKGRVAFEIAQKFFPDSAFSAADLSAKSGEKIYAATLNGIVSKGYMEKLGGSPVTYKFIDDLELMLAMDAAQSAGCDNTNLHSAKKVKNDEFYTRIEDVEKEVFNYRRQFRDKKVFLNCNDTQESAFWQYFFMNFDLFELSRLTAISYNKNGQAEMIWIDTNENRINGNITEDSVQRKNLKSNGSFNSEESLAILEDSDIVVTNPPFSVFREYIDILIRYNKKFLVIGNQNAYTYQDVFKLIRENKIWPGINGVHNFRQPDGSIAKFGNISWFTNMPTKVRNEPMILTATYYDDINKREEYPIYDNYKAINVDKVVNIPKDYHGIMGVPITFLNKYCPEQFEIIGQTHTGDTNPAVEALRTDPNHRHGGFVNGKEKYMRILIRYKENIL